MRKKKFIVLARNKKIAGQGLVTGKGKRSFGNYSALWISDPAEAREIEQQYGTQGSRDVSVTTDQQYEWSINNDGSNGTRTDNIHHYTFQGVDISKLRRTTESPNVWAIRDGKQILIKRQEAYAEGLEIVPGGG